MTAALDRVSDVLSVGARTAVTPTVPPSRLVTLARYGLTAKAPAIKLLAEPRRTATLLATAQALETALGTADSLIMDSWLARMRAGYP